MRYRWPLKTEPVNSRLIKFMQLLVGRWEPPIVVAFAKLGLGIVIPGVVLLYGISCVLSRDAKVIARGGFSEINGLPAVAVGIAYATIGMIIYVHICWDNHPYFAGFRDAARQLLLVVIIIALGATFGLALF